ncbi:hypothetical protein EMIHUDRAFT_454368 [Emiliania huxleyi CCMP1516]|uniref:Zn(2)-C6 fungal-type domain-containing protein n=2 Tax=Emiliania huxleyi TaxID=2903 RepID=A0A0D3KW73_EMIH1|nr:hypothetical protein EMIHUDRAFT_454368 [Emiliania huxleyi CCMP1516]EOD40008.1 hypothetical protein EMIHUDRAFT_454368 [Emiliania huxleyi CCMP1516]|eukprot:XP_005792437.1 hypothetical protein EMIHUDRAFT_454368 [Emiliania huxleyi CCMP1516]
MLPMPGWNNAQTMFMVPPTISAPQQQLGQVVVAPQIVAMTSLDPRFQPLPLQPGETAFYPSGERRRAKQACMACWKAKLRCTMLQCGSCLSCVERGRPCIPRVRMKRRQTRERPPYPSLDLARAQEAALQSLPPLPPLQPMPPSAVGLEDLWGGAQGLQPGAAPNSPTVAGLPAVAPVAAPDQASLTAALCSSYSMHLQRSLADSMSLSQMLAALQRGEPVAQASLWEVPAPPLAAESSTETLEAPQDEHRAPPLAQLVSLKRPRDTKEYTKDHDSIVDEVARREVVRRGS